MNPTRATRAQLARGAARIRADQQRHGAPVHAIAAQITRDLPITWLEAWRLAYGWSRPSVVDAVGEVYRSDGLAPPGLTTAMLCRWEHGQARPGWDYVAALARVYRVDPSRLGVPLPVPPAGWYGHRIPQPRQEPPMPAEYPELTAVADSIALHGAGDLAEQALEYYDQYYSDYPPRVLASEVARCRGLLVTHQDPDTRRVLGWLSAMLGNLAHHSADAPGALIHLGTAARIGAQVGEPHLAGWALGAQSMVAMSQHRYAEALELADQAEPYADKALRRAQVVAWCRLRPLAAVGDADGVGRAVVSARRHMNAAEEAPGRFGFDRAEFELHVAEALVGADPVGAARHAETSAGLKRAGSPGWAAATAILARTHAARHGVGDACAVAGEVLDAVPPERLRETTRARLRMLVSDLRGQATPGVRELEERVRAL